MSVKNLYPTIIFVISLVKCFRFKGWLSRLLVPLDKVISRNHILFFGPKNLARIIGNVAKAVNYFRLT